jgi:hypothetical protein
MSKKQKISFTIIFALLGLAALQVPVWQLAGSKAAFTLFDFFGPIAPAFIGTLPGLAAVFLTLLVNFFIHGAQVLDAGTIVRFFPPLFAALYFEKQRRVLLIVPAVAIVAFIANPVGRSVWYFSLFWLVPLAAHLLRERFLFARALGATFTAHAVGGALWIWAFALPAPVWIALVPVVIKERLLFAAGIAVAHLAATSAFHFLAERTPLVRGIRVERRYALPLLRPH